MIILEKVKYIYMFSSLIILLSSFIIVSFKITNLLLPVVNHDNSLIYGSRFKYLIKEVRLSKLILLSLIGISICILIFFLINDTTLFKVANESLEFDLKSTVIEYINQLKK